MGQAMQDPGVLWFMIKKAHFGDQIQDHNRGELRCHPEASGAGFETITKKLRFSWCPDWRKFEPSPRAIKFAHLSMSPQAGEQTTPSDKESPVFHSNPVSQYQGSSFAISGNRSRDYTERKCIGEDHFYRRRITGYWSGYRGGFRSSGC